MAWVSRGQTHYTGPGEEPMERFSTELPPLEDAEEKKPDKGKVKRFKVVTRKPKLDRREADLMAYGRQSRELFSKMLFLRDQLADTGSLLQGLPASASSRT